MECNQISDNFLAMHEADGFKTLPAASLLHSSVPMSFVMSAGLIQIENELDQIVAASGPQFCFTQPCFRHFDVKQVGQNSMHLSLFHMSAAFNMGSTDRSSVLPRLWQFLTQTLSLSTDKLWISYLDDSDFGLDQQSYDCWQSIGVDKTHLIGLDQQHNFWRQRQSGQIAQDGKKCGPHTEIFYERDDIKCHCDRSKTIKEQILHCHCGRFIEISNSLFIENYINDEEQLIVADTVFSECVIGIERIAMILQQVSSVYHIERFKTSHNALSLFCSQQLLQQFSQPFPPQRLQPLKTSLTTTSFAIIIDHLSAFVILINDGAPAPGRGGRARIMRNLARAVMTQALLHDLDVMLLLQHLLIEKQQQQSRVLLEQEYSRFATTLTRGKRKLLALYQRKQLITDDIQDQFQYKWGVPPCLFVKFQKILAADPLTTTDDIVNIHKQVSEQ
jgi:alanyl-tRNA synthetase